MPELSPKQIQAELDRGKVRPFYWIYGPERLKIRELRKRIHTAKALPPETPYDGATADVHAILDEAKSLGLFSSQKFIVVENAHELDTPEALAPLFEESDTTCVFISKNLDGRLKFTKTLLENAAVVPCEEVAENEREAWIHYLAKRQNLSLPLGVLEHLKALDPWNLGIIETELQKLLIAGTLEFSEGDQIQILTRAGAGSQGQEFIDAFFSKNKKRALSALEHFAKDPEESIPLLGLVGWNARMLLLFISDQKSARIPPFSVDRFRKWSANWSAREIKTLNTDLCRIDFSSKQTATSPLGLWANWVHRSLV